MQSKDKPSALPDAGGRQTSGSPWMNPRAHRERRGAGLERRPEVRPSMVRLHVFAILLVLTALSGCTSTRGEPRPPSRVEGISLEVNNQSRNAVTIYVWSDTYQNRLGMVEALNRDTFNFRWNLVGRVYFLMDFLAQGCVLSEPIDVIDGDELILTVQPIDHRRASRAACRRP